MADSKINDVWVVWAEGMENGYEVLEPYEWDKEEDYILVFTSFQLVKVTTRLFNYIKNSLGEIPEELLEFVKNQSYTKLGSSKLTIQYAFIMSDGEDTLAVDTMSYKTPIRKSNLIPRQQRFVIDRYSKLDLDPFDIPEEGLETPEYGILNLEPSRMLGLTRKEKNLKRLLMMCLDDLRVDLTAKGRINYWYTEWHPDSEDLVDVDPKDTWLRLYEEVSYGWSPQHESLCKQLAKTNGLFETMWEKHSATKKKVK